MQDAELSFVMCTLGHVSRGTLVYDPFAGTGSILIAATARGANVIGADIDIRAIRDGKRDDRGEQVNVYTNFKDYELRDPAGLLRMDAAHAAWRQAAAVGRQNSNSDLNSNGGATDGGLFDAIVCDPPYGVRAGGRTMAPRPEGAQRKQKQCAADYLLSCPSLQACIVFPKK